MSMNFAIHLCMVQCQFEIIHTWTLQLVPAYVPHSCQNCGNPAQNQLRCFYLTGDTRMFHRHSCPRLTDE